MFGLRRSRRVIAFLPPALTTKDYFGLLVHSLAWELLHGHPSFFLVVVPPLHDYELDPDGAHDGSRLTLTTQEEFLEGVASDGRFAAIILVPISPDHLVHSVEKLLRRRRCPNLVIYDRPFSVAQREHLNEISGRSCALPHVYVDGREGGRLAAKMLHRAAVVRGLSVAQSTVQILIGTHAVERAEGFCEEWARLTGREDACRRSDPIAFDRDEARRFCESQLPLPFTEDNPPLFFCCNDEMALGVRDHVAKGVSVEAQGRPVIVGFDGIPTIKALIAEHDPFMVGTVDVDVAGGIAKTLSEVVGSLVDSKRTLSQTKVIVPRIYFEGGRTSL